jgi:hypothetical protein
MRLTLRTLLAWLDDTLSPAEVREIGKQVTESPYAQELVERINRVTRQRRLTVPSSSGPDATDPNMVASYLDNELDQDLVPEYEKLCLTSDVHMAEVASVHQILSLIGQKAKVPVEVKNRMYSLVRGREAIAPRPRNRQPAASPPVSEPIGSWITPELPDRPWYERYGPALGAVGLLALLCWSAWMSLSPSQPPDTGLARQGRVEGGNEAGIPGSGAAGAPTAPAGAPAIPPAGSGAAEAPALAKNEAVPAKPETGAATSLGAANPGLAPGMVGMTQKTEGVLLRYLPESRDWEQLIEPTPLNVQDRLLSLDPFRTALAIGSARVDLVGETEIILGAAAANQAGRFELRQGRVALQGTSPAAPYNVLVDGRAIQITPPTGTTVGIERVSRFEPGNPASSASVLRIHGSDGEVALEAGDAKETLSGAATVVWDDGKWIEKADKPAPNWVTESTPTPYDVQVGEQFRRFFRPGRPVIAVIVEALDDDQKEVRRLALRALRMVGDLSDLTPVLSRSEDPLARREAIRVLRVALAQGPDAAKLVHGQLIRDFGEDQATSVEKLLIGFTPEEARSEATYNTLVKSLTSNEIAIRELALDNLRSLTGRDDLEYDPDKPEGRGLRAWQDLLRKREILPANAVGKAEK